MALCVIHAATLMMAMMTMQSAPSRTLIVAAPFLERGPSPTLVPFTGDGVGDVGYAVLDGDSLIGPKLGDIVELTGIMLDMKVGDVSSSIGVGACELVGAGVFGAAVDVPTGSGVVEGETIGEGVGARLSDDDDGEAENNGAFEGIDVGTSSVCGGRLGNAVVGGRVRDGAVVRVGPEVGRIVISTEANVMRKVSDRNVVALSRSMLPIETCRRRRSSSIGVTVTRTRKSSLSAPGVSMVNCKVSCVCPP